MLAALIAITLRADTLNVYAAASLKDAFTSIAKKFEATNKDVKVQLSFGGSQTLVAQINNGAPADIFASAAVKNMTEIDYVKTSMQYFAKNRLVIILRKDQTGIATVKNLPIANKIVVADPSVPAGKYAEQFFNLAAKRLGQEWLNQVRAHIVSKESDVRSVLTKVQLGEADAGIVYVTDAISAKDKITQVQIPTDMNTIATYPIAITTASKNKAGAQRFIEFLMTPASQNDLASYGFITARATRLHP